MLGSVWLLGGPQLVLMPFPNMPLWVVCCWLLAPLQVTAREFGVAGKAGGTLAGEDARAGDYSTA